MLYYIVRYSKVYRFLDSISFDVYNMNRVDNPNYYVCVLYEIIRYDLILVRIARYAHKAKLPKSIYTLLNC